MDALVAVLMDGFRDSNWCDQEVGFAVGRDVLIIPIRKGLDPYGFIGRYQGIQGMNKTVGNVADSIFNTIVKSIKTRSKMLLALCNAIGQSTGIDEALEKLDILNSVDSVPEYNLENLRNQIRDNNLLIESDKFMAAVNALFTKFNVVKITAGSQPPEEDWDDIPF